MKKLLTLSLMTFTSLGVQAAIVSTTDTDTDSMANLVPAISSSDLLQTNLLSSSISGFDPVATYAPALPNGGNLFDGLDNTSGGVAFGEAYIDSSTGSEWVAEFTLDTSSNIYGYELTGINSFSGWNSGLASQDFTLEVSTIDSAGFTSLGRFTQSANNVGLVVAVSEDDSGILASNVDVVRFTHHTGSSDARGAYRELDVFGTPSAVPEPSTVAALLGVAALAFVGFRRRKG